MNMNNVTAVIVTYNRKKLLIECLNAIIGQTVPPQKVIVINNASTDGTEELFENNGMFCRDNIRCINMPTNTGGSGGFHEGMKQVLHDDSEWVWIMDDDTIPNPDCLEKLLSADEIVSSKNGAKEASFYASTIWGADGEFMNVPNISNSKAENGYQNYYEFLNKSMIKIADATFVSLLIRKNAIVRCGLPCKDYFIWGDDGEYTLRLIHYYGPAYMVGDSVAIHKRVGAKALSISNFNEPDRIKMYHYYVRNNIINSLFYKKDKSVVITLVKKILQAISSIKYISQKHGFLKCKVIWQGTLEGLFQYRKFKSYIENQLSND